MLLEAGRQVEILSFRLGQSVSFAYEGEADAQEGPPCRGSCRRRRAGR